jgi:hypothetical protein
MAVKEAAAALPAPSVAADRSAAATLSVAMTMPGHTPEGAPATQQRRRGTAGVLHRPHRPPTERTADAQRRVRRGSAGSRRLIATRTGAINIALSPGAPATATVTNTVTVTASPGSTAPSPAGAVHATSPASATPTIIVSSSAESPDFLSNISPADENQDDFSAGDGVIDKNDYADSIWGCFDLLYISECDEQRSAGYADYNIPGGYNYFTATVGFRMILRAAAVSTCSCLVMVQNSLTMA